MLKKKKIVLPEGSNWVLWMVRTILVSAQREITEKRSSFPYIRAALLLLIIPVWFLAASLNLFWLLVFGFVAWFIGWAVLKGGIILFRFPADSYIEAVMLACFWAAVFRVPFAIWALFQ